MRVLVFPGFLATKGDADLVRGALSSETTLEEVDLLELSARGSWTHAVSHAASLVRDDDVLVGYSMGARLVLAILATTRPRVRGALLLSGTPGLVEAEVRRARALDERARGDALRTDPHRFIDTWGAHPLFAHAREHPALVAQRARRHALASPAWASAWADALTLFGQGTASSAWSALALLDVPILWIAGARDPQYVEIARRAAALSPGGVVHVVPGVGHALLAEAPEAVASFIRELSHRAAVVGRAQEVPHASGAPDPR